MTEKRRGRPRWLAVVELSKGQKGLVRRDQLLAIGVPLGTIDSWVRQGLLHSVYDGIYMVGQPLLLPKADVLASIWACGPEAFLSHRPATEEWEMIEARRGFALQITVPGHRQIGPTGIYVHRTNDIYPDEITVTDGIPITTPARTIFDFASQATMAEVSAAYERGLIDELFTRDDMIKMAMRHKGRRGIRKIRALIDRDAPPTVTIKEAHRLLLELVRSSGLPHPKTEVPIGQYRVDMLWADAMLVVEMDSAKWHNSPGKIEHDKRRDAELAAKGYLTLRITWTELTQRPTEVIARIAQTYATRRPSPSRSGST